MRCSGCGFENPEGAGWCGHCREPLQPVQGPIVEPPSQTHQPPIVPPPYQTHQPPGVPPPFEYPAPPPAPSRVRVSRTVIMVAVVSGLVLLVGVAFMARQFVGPFRGRIDIGKALDLERDGRVEDALALYQKAVSEAPKDAGVRLAYAQALWRRERYEEATAQYDEAFRLDPDNAILRLIFAEVLRGDERYDDAIEQYDKALQIDPEMEDAWVTLGIAAYEGGDLDKSADAYRKALKLDDGLSIAHNNLAYVLYDQDKVDEAVAEWEKAVGDLSDGDANQQGQADCWAGLAIGYLAQDKRGKAIRTFRRAIAIDRGYLSTRYMKEEAFWSDKALEAAEELIPEVRVRPSPLPGDALPSA